MNNRILKFLAVLLVSSTLPGCSLTSVGANDCEIGYDKIISGDFQQARTSLTKCISSKKTDTNARRHALLTRAWIHSRLKDFNAAVKDQESAFAISPASDFEEQIDYVAYLRAANRSVDSLAILKTAEYIERASANSSMTVHYYSGRSLQNLGQHEQAIDIFSSSIPTQPEYAFVYYRRGISFEALGRKAEAKADFEKSAQLLGQVDVEKTSGRLLPKMLAKFKEYGIELADRSGR